MDSHSALNSLLHMQFPYKAIVGLYVCRDIYVFFYLILFIYFIFFLYSFIYLHLPFGFPFILEPLIHTFILGFVGNTFCFIP